MGSRKSSVNAEARRIAFERAARFQEREEKLLAAAVEYAEAEAELSEVGSRFDAAFAELQAQRESAERAARLKTAQAAKSMVDLDVSKAEAAERLGITRAELNDVLRLAEEPQKTATSEGDDDSTAASAGVKPSVASEASKPVDKSSALGE